eukprot:gene1109-1266_t
MALKENRELKSRLVALSKSTGVPIDGSLLQMAELPPPPTPSAMTSSPAFNIEGSHRSILNPGGAIAIPISPGSTSFLTSPSSSASSSPSHNHHYESPLRLTDSNESNINHNNHHHQQQDHINKLELKSLPINTIINDAEPSSPSSPFSLYTSPIHSPSILNTKNNNSKRQREFSPLGADGSLASVLNAANNNNNNNNPNNNNISSSSLSNSNGNNNNNINISGNNNNFTSPTSPYASSPSLSFSPLSKFHGAANNNNNNNNTSFTPPLASFSSILSITSPSSSPLVASLPSSPSTTYLTNDFSNLDTNSPRPDLRRYKPQHHPSTNK